MTQQYYKWMFETEHEITRIPGFVTMSIEDATKFSKDFEDWCYNENNTAKNLYTFKGIPPTPIKQHLTSHFGFATKPYTTPQVNIQNTLAYFNTKPVDYFTYANSEKDIPLMLAIAKQTGCIAYDGPKNKWISTREALYLHPAKMIKVDPQTLIATTQ